MKEAKAFAIGIGKTTLAVVLAILIVEFGKKVIIPKFKKVEAPAEEEGV